MLLSISEKAYAKVNFNLRVFPKREDGFHDIQGIFQTIDLFDELTVCVSEESGCCVYCDKMVLPEKNTITNAYQAFKEIIARDFPYVQVPGIQVNLKKGIPAGGGLGGGSSDAAALIRALEKACNISLTDTQLDYIAGRW